VLPPHQNSCRSLPPPSPPQLSARERHSAQTAASDIDYIFLPTLSFEGRITLSPELIIPPFHAQCRSDNLKFRCSPPPPFSLFFSLCGAFLRPPLTPKLTFGLHAYIWYPELPTANARTRWLPPARTLSSQCFPSPPSPRKRFWIRSARTKTRSDVLRSPVMALLLFLFPLFCEAFLPPPSSMTHFLSSARCIRFYTAPIGSVSVHLFPVPLVPFFPPIAL